jgi:tyrosyl-tRNA synthetase
MAGGSARPNDLKRAMARAVVDLYHGDGAGRGAEEGSTGCTGTGSSPRWCRTSGSRTERSRTGSSGCRGCSWHSTATSNGDGRRRIEQGGVKLDDEPITDLRTRPAGRSWCGKVLQVGRRWFGRLA